MLAMHLPRGAVEQKMVAEGVDVKILDLDPTKPMPEPAAKASGPPVGEDPKYKKYFKMLAMHLPRGAVEQKMMAEGVDVKILDLDPTKPMPGAGGGEAAGPPVGEDPKYKKYFKMLAMHLPRGAVEQKMMAEGVDVKILDLDPTKPMPGAGGGEPSGPPVGDDPRYKKYFKMLAMHLPRGAVEQKMMAEGMDPKILDLDPTTPAPAAAAPSGPPVGEDPKYAKYFKMLKMHLPRGAVEQKMIAEGMDPKVLDLDPTKPAPAAAAGGGVKSAVTRGLAAKKAAQKLKLKALFWTKLGGDDAAGTVWGDFPKEAATGAPTVAAIERLFGTKPAKKKEAAGEEKKSEGVQLVDGKRNQNVLIGLGRVKLSHAGIRDAIVGLDFKALPQLETAGGVEVFLTLVPEPEEVAEVGRYIQGFGDEAAALASLAPVEHFFAVGNVLNRDTARGDARGFRPDMLPKLATIKCNDPKDGTLVDVITNALDEASVVGLERDLDAVPSAAAVDGKELDGDLKALEKTLSKSIEVELKAAEAASDAGAKPFAKLVKPLGAAARKRCDATAADLAEAVAASKAAMARFGAVPPADGADPSKAFYANVRDFAADVNAAHLRAVSRREKAAKDEAKAAAKRDRAAKKGGAPSPPASPAGGDLQADLRNALRAPRLRKAKPRPPPGAGAKPTWQQKATASAAPKDDILAAFKQRQDMSAADIVKDWVR
ncbi:actin binding protein [Aureococcus anophagefferens]|uniref:Actin binding protein n=1 Tax=Aureococcus anophagefferens TaxID=44056 RepID=A0ABR1FJX7_AURAN